MVHNESNDEKMQYDFALSCASGLIMLLILILMQPNKSNLIIYCLE